MATINVLIIENSPASVNIIKRGIKWYNELNTGYFISIIGEASSYETAVAVINSRTESVHLIFLDMELNTSKSGLDICKEFPTIAYILVSIDSSAQKKITNETTAHYYYYIEKAAEGVFSADDIVSALTKYINTKGDFIFNDVLNIKGEKILMNRVAIISSTEQKLHYRENENKFFLIDTTSNTGKSLNFFSENYLQRKQVSANIPIQVLRSRNFGRPHSYSLEKIIEENALNHNKFLQISRSVIINREFLHDCDTKNFEYFDLLVSNYYNSIRNNYHDIIVRINVERRNYLSDKDKNNLLEYLNSAIHRH